MVNCAAKGCKNRSEKGVKMYGFPVNRERREEWLRMSRCTLANDADPNHKKICQEHFEEDQFELTKNGKTRLVSDAVPSIFSHLPRRKRRRIIKKFIAPVPISAAEIAKRIHTEHSYTVKADIEHRYTSKADTETKDAEIEEVARKFFSELPSKGRVNIQQVHNNAPPVPLQQGSSPQPPNHHGNLIKIVKIVKMASPVEMTDMYDHALLGILQHVGNIEDFLKVYFGFLFRKTDFYRLLSPSNQKLGFPPGVAERMVFQTYKLFEKVSEQDRERRQSEVQKREESRRVPAAVQELEITTEEVSTTEISTEVSSSTDQFKMAATAAAVCEAEEEEEVVVSEQKKQQSVKTKEKKKTQSSAVEVKAEKSENVQSENKEKQNVSKGEGAAAAACANPTQETQEKFQADPDTYNGAVRENYSWSQDYTDLEIRVFVPKTIRKGKQVSVVLQSSRMKVCIKDAEEEEKTLMEGEFTHLINTENSLWSLEPASCVVLSLSKTSEVWWSAVLKGEQEIDINHINRERSMATVDEEEHAVLDRLTFDYHQKLQGKPQSHEMKVHDMLRKGWDAEGSPFKGQQFDPSQFDIPQSAVQF